MLFEEAVFLKTSINVPILKEYLFRTHALVKSKQEEGLTGTAVSAIEEGRS